MTTSDKFIVTADNHLRPRVWTNQREISGDTYRGFEAVVQLCLDQQADLVILGDLFDSPRPDSQSVTVLVTAVNRMQTRGLRVFAVQGNHDTAVPAWAGVAGVIPMHGRCEVLAGLRCYGLDWQPGTLLTAALASIPADTQVLFTHQSWAEVQRVGKTDGSLQDVPHPLTVLTGDYHQCLSGDVETPAGTVTWASPGPSAIQAIDEPPQKYCLVVQRIGDQPRVSAVELPGRAVESVWVRSAAELDAVVRDLSDWPETTEDLRPLLRLNYLDTVAEAFNRVEAATVGRFFVFPSPFSPPPGFGEVATTDGEDPTGDVGLAEALSQAEPDQDVVSGAVALLRSADFAETYARLRTAFCAAGSP